jgi:hypothetical protein
VLNAARYRNPPGKAVRNRPMMSDPLITPADACAPDADRAGPDASARLPQWVVHLLALVIRFILERTLAGRSGCSRLPSWWHDRPDLPPGSAQAEAAAVRGTFGTAIAWMCQRRGIGPGHPDWPELSRAIVAFGGSLKEFRFGGPAWGLQWWEHPGIIPGTAGEPKAAPAAEAMALLLSRHAAAAPWAAPEHLAPTHIVRAAVAPALPLALRRHVFARTATGPPTGPHCITGPPAISAHQFCYA